MSNATRMGNATNGSTTNSQNASSQSGSGVEEAELYIRMSQAAERIALRLTNLYDFPTRAELQGIVSDNARRDGAHGSIPITFLNSMLNESQDSMGREGSTGYGSVGVKSAGINAGTAVLVLGQGGILLRLLMGFLIFLLLFIPARLGMLMNWLRCWILMLMLSKGDW